MFYYLRAKVEKVIVMVDETPTTEYVPTGMRELDTNLGKGVPIGSLGLIEGETRVGKSVFSQQVAYSTLCSTEHSVAYYTSQYGVSGLVAQMDSLSMSVVDYFLLDRFRVYPVTLPRYFDDTRKPFIVLTDHLSRLPECFKVVIVDSITNLVTHTTPGTVIEFFRLCKKLCDEGRSIFLVAHSLTFDRETFNRVSAICDLYLRASFVDHDIYGLVNILELLRVQWATRFSMNKFLFEIQAGVGIHNIPLTEMRV